MPGLTQNDLIVTDAFVLAVSLLVTVTRVVTLISQARARQITPRKSEIIGAVFLVLSCILVAINTVLFRYVGYMKIKNKTTTFPNPVDPTADEVSWAQLPIANQLNYVTVLLQTLSLWMIKGSYLCTFFTIAKALKDSIRRTIYGLSVFMVVSYLATLFADLFYCGKTSNIWAFGGECGPYSIPPFSVKLAMTLASDLALFGLAIWIVQTLNIRPKSERFAILIIFAIGFMSIISSCTRYAYNYQFTIAEDVEYIIANGNYFSFWMKVEVLFATAAYGLTTMRALLRHVVVTVKKLTGYSNSSKSGRSKSSNNSWRMKNSGNDSLHSHDDVQHIVREKTVTVTHESA